MTWPPCRQVIVCPKVVVLDPFGRLSHLGEIHWSNVGRFVVLEVILNSQWGSTVCRTPTRCGLCGLHLQIPIGNHRRLSHRVNRWMFGLLESFALAWSRGNIPLRLVLGWQNPTKAVGFGTYLERYLDLQCLCSISMHILWNSTSFFKVPTELEVPNQIDQGETEVRNKEARPKVFPKSPNTLDAMEQATLHHAWSKFQILPAFAHNLLLIQSLMRGGFPFSCQFWMPSLCSEHVSRCNFRLLHQWLTFR